MRIKRLLLRFLIMLLKTNNINFFWFVTILYIIKEANFTFVKFKPASFRVNEFCLLLPVVVFDVKAGLCKPL